MLLDPDSPFLELCIFAGYQQSGSSPCASVVAGIGVVRYSSAIALLTHYSGIKCVVSASIPTIEGGSSNAFSVLKGMRLANIAETNNLPSISLVQTAGASLPQQFRVFHTGGQSFRNTAIRSERGCPTCSVVFGSSTAGGAYAPGMSDYTIFVEKQAQVFLGGPPLVKMATGEVNTAEELGGAEMHSKVSGLADQMARDEFEGIALARRWVYTIRRVEGQMGRCIFATLPLYNPGFSLKGSKLMSRGIVGDYSDGHTTADEYARGPSSYR
jgi:acetyl-CoA carboxylase carboxyltransferase component